MSNYKFTPGPWEPYAFDTHTVTPRLKGLGVVAIGKHEVCCAYGWTVEETEANAKLIAAAPELLKFAEHFLDNLEGFMPEAVRTIAELKALIKKATE